jgi:hypothetical protein
MTTSRRSSIELLEESIDLLRSAPASAWAWYLAGAAPFFGAVLIFWSRTTGATAAPDPLPGALLLALLFGWRQYTRAYFGGELYRLPAGSEPARHSWSAFIAAWFAGIARIPLLVVPFPTLIALFRNVSILAPRAESPTAAFSRASALATRGSNQTAALLTVAGASLIVWVNVFTGLVAIPALFQIFTGQSTILTQSLGALLNGAVMLASAILAWSIMDVVLTAFYALRVFSGESEETGADLLGSWRRAAALAVVALLILLTGHSAIADMWGRGFRPDAGLPPGVFETPGTGGLRRTGASETPGHSAKAELPAAKAELPGTGPDLNRAIDQVLRESPYQWRQPPAAPKEQNAFVRWTDNLFRSVRHSFAWVRRVWNDFVDWLRNHATPPKKSNAPPPVLGLTAFSWIVIVVLAGALVALLMRAKLPRRNSSRVPAMPAGPAAIDLEDPSVLASQLPENEWTAMARDFMARGDYRMALRAYFLASLAFLASRELVVVGRSKTNLDYLREVRRRARSAAGLDGLFARGIEAFESAWYGLHEVGVSDVSRFEENLERMRSLLPA